jgi:prepilin signal peptidase PulO-like enzyme (type II secretory pathway)
MIIFVQAVFCFFVGAIFGNICTSLFFRLPRNIPINGITHPPMCSNCGVKIKYPYYGPFFQFLFKGLKCFNCKAKIPIIYTFIEFFSGIFSVIFFLIFNVSEYFIVCYLGLIMIFLSYLIFLYHNAFFTKLNWVIVVLAIIKIHFDLHSGEDFIFFILFYRLINGLIFCLFISKIIKKIEIEFICFFIGLSLFINQFTFLIASIISISLIFIFKLKNGIFIIPFLLFTFVSLLL